MVNFLEPADARNAIALRVLRRKPRSPSSMLSLVTLWDPSPTPRNASLYSAGTS